MSTRCTILVLFRADSVRRLNNLSAVINLFRSLHHCSVYIREADCIQNHLLPTILPDHIKYEYVEDHDTILHKTWHFNQMLKSVSDPIIGIWDTDIIPYPEALDECLRKISQHDTALALPYNGICLDTSETIANLYCENYEFSILDRYRHLMKYLNNQRLTGGAVLMNRKAFISLGAENENYYGWGDDDFDRYIRFMNSGLRIFRSQTPLFHLTHPRGKNSCFSSALFVQNSKQELAKTINTKVIPANDSINYKTHT